MKPEIKQRIEQLNNGKIPKGYKKTDFGVFPSDWVTDKKLIDIGTFGKGKGIPGNKMQSDGVPCVGYGDIYMKYNYFHFEEAQSFVDEETAKDSQLIKKGTLLFTGTGETAEEIGKCVCYNGYSTICAGGDIITFVPQDVNPLFLAYQQYQNFSLKKKASFGQGHSVVHIQKESLEKLNVAYPESKNEQSRIVEILMKWDKAIELYDKQIDALTRYKAVCLKKMFPIKGQSVPEWRFQGFSGDWEQRKFSDLVLIERGGSPRPIDSFITDAPNGLNWVKIGDVPEQGRYITKTAEKIRPEGLSKTREVHPGDLILSNSMSFGKPYIMGIDGCIHDGWLLIRNTQKRFDLKFLCHMLGSEQMLNQYRSLAAGSTVNNLNKELVGNTTVTIPELEEQQVLGQYFESLDHLITLHQRKKEVITNQRKTLQQYLLNGIIRV